VSYRDLTAHMRRISSLSHVSAIVGWDEAVMMPTGGGEARAQAMSTLDGQIHAMATDPRVGDWLQAAKREPLTPEQQANLREIERGYRRATALPQDLVEAISSAQLRCQQAWRSQRADNDWAGHEPLLEEVFRLKREEASALSERFGIARYDALMDSFEPGMQSARVDVLFSALEQTLPSLIEQVIARQARETLYKPQGPFETAAQRDLGMRLMASIGFDFEHGRLDTSHHPFCGGVPDDVRITTRYNEHDFTESLMGVLHETGHAKYEQHLPSDFRDQPVGMARSMGVHESQSLFQEMQICRGRPFMEFATPMVREAFATHAVAQPLAFTPENLTRLYTRVERGFIRVDADEVTYPLHVALRYRVEKAVIEGQAEVADIPELWHEHMQRALALSTAGNFKDGCMQDVHWPSGAVGYFPSYTLGALIAAQLFEAVHTALPELNAQIARGEFEPLNAWLDTRVWSKGSLLSTDALIESATGHALGTDAFLRHVKRRYLA
jgi:carboxypeptidase Taq